MAEPFSTAYSRNNFVCLIIVARTATEVYIAPMLSSASFGLNGVHLLYRRPSDKDYKLKACEDQN
jgi:hypothetical protein